MSDAARYGRDVGRRRRFHNVSVTNIFNTFIAGGGSDVGEEPSDGDELVVGNTVMTVKQYRLDSATDIVIDCHAPTLVGQLLLVINTGDTAQGGVLRLQHNDSGNQYFVSSGFQNFTSVVASPGSSSYLLAIGIRRESLVLGEWESFLHWGHIFSDGWAFTLN